MVKLQNFPKIVEYSKFGSIGVREVCFCVCLPWFDAASRQRNRGMLPQAFKKAIKKRIGNHKDIIKSLKPTEKLERL